MAQLFPFQGYRFSTEQVGQIEDVISQPYDKITSQMRQNYRQRHPHNIVRIIKNSDYAEAGHYWTQWVRKGILRADQSASFYPYEQTFDFEGKRLSRSGLICLISLEEADPAVKGHEKILHDPLEDRLNLIRVTQANEGLIFMLYSDPSLQVDRLLSEFTKTHPPVTRASDEHKVLHRLWQMTDRDDQEKISGCLKTAPFYIADGHHRFETSLIYHRECLKKGWKTRGVESFDKRMIALFNMEHPGVKILPTHRAIRGLGSFRPEKLLSHLKSFFRIEKVPSIEQLHASLKDSKHRIGLLLGPPTETIYLLELVESNQARLPLMEAMCGPARDLEVNILHEGILRPYLGIGPEELASQKHVDYYRDQTELYDLVRQGRYQVAFLLRPTSIQQVREISELGEKMPQKSTDFYPKLATGLVLMKMGIDKSGL